MAVFDHDGVLLAYDDTGETGLPPVLLLHGVSSARSTWRRLVPTLDGRCRTLALDLRGHGESGHAPGTYTLEHYVPDVISFPQDRVGQPPGLIGHSLRGVVSPTVAQQRPALARAALLEAPPLYLRAHAADADRPLLTMFTVMRQVYGEMQAR